MPSMVRKFYGSGVSVLEIIRRCGCKPWRNPSGGGSWVDFRFVGGPHGEPDDPDGDGIDTVIEIWLGCNPNDDDSDGDGLSDLREIELGTDPTDDDSDGDGMTTVERSSSAATRSIPTATATDQRTGPIPRRWSRS